MSGLISSPAAQLRVEDCRTRRNAETVVKKRVRVDLDAPSFGSNVPTFKPTPKAIAAPIPKKTQVNPEDDAVEICEPGSESRDMFAVCDAL